MKAFIEQTDFEEGDLRSVLCRAQISPDEVRRCVLSNFGSLRVTFQDDVFQSDFLLSNEEFDLLVNIESLDDTLFRSYDFIFTNQQEKTKLASFVVDLSYAYANELLMDNFCIRNQVTWVRVLPTEICEIELIYDETTGVVSAVQETGIIYWQNSRI